jgi:hypothetical protein
MSVRRRAGQASGGKRMIRGIGSLLSKSHQVQHRYRRVARQRFERVELLACGVHMLFHRSILKLSLGAL